MSVLLAKKNSRYISGLYFIEFKFNYNYPNEGPIDAQMRTPTYHPNICCNTGHVYVKYFSEWKNTNNIIGIANTLFDLLAEENPGNIMNIILKK